MNTGHEGSWRHAPRSPNDGSLAPTVHDGRILGCASVAPGHVDLDDLPASTRKKTPRYPFLRLARLAVSQQSHSQGVGTQLLRFVCRITTEMAEAYGCVGLVVDAKPEAVEFYARYGFIPFDGVEGESSARPRPTMLFLAMRAIKASRKLPH